MADDAAVPPQTAEIPGVEALDFERESVQRLYRLGSGISDERWDRARNDVLFADVLQELTGKRDTVVSCPFHGRDRRPSFTLFAGSNDAYCFGCPPGSQLYDNVTFVSRYLEVSKGEALSWIEKTFDLPYIADSGIAEDEDEDEELSFQDLAEPFILRASQAIQETKDPELAEGYLSTYFTADGLEKAAKSAEEDGPSPLELHQQASRELASIFDKEHLVSIALRCRTTNGKA